MKKKLSKILVLCLSAVMVLSLAACGSSTETLTEDITVVSREEGSGTRDAFVELTGVMEDDVDNTVDTAEISNSTSVVIQSVAGNVAAIGYISLGSLDDSVKAVQVDGVDATTDNVLSGDYALQRPFNIVTGDDVSDLAQDFIDYIMSAEGQAIVSEEGYVAIDEDAESYSGGGYTGTITVAGSTSVAPLMEVLAEAYMELNSGVTIEIQQTGSSAGIQSTIEGVCDIGMSSRELKDEETAEGVTSLQIALDGIAVIVNTENGIESLTMEQIKQIFTGEITNWADLS